MTARRPVPVLRGVEQLALLAIQVGLAILASKLLKPKKRSPIDDDKPTTLTTRGSYLSWWMGIREIGPAFGWAGEREKRKEKVPGGKGGLLSPKQDVWYEAGWHQLGTGPVDALHEIRQQNQTIFRGPITPDSHPSGTTIDTGGEGAFTIFWGESNQPINTYLGDAGRVSIASRWPHLCYVVWNKKRLGGSPIWPILTYVCERRPSGAFLSSSQPWYFPTATLSGSPSAVVAFVANASPTTGYLEVVGDLSQEYQPGRQVAVAGNALPDGDYVVLKTTIVRVVVGTTGAGFPIFETRTRVFFTTGTAGADGSGTVEHYLFATDDGANVAHAVADLLFAPFPQGRGLDPAANVEGFDLQSLEDWGAEAETLGLRASIISVDGNTIEALLGNALQDHGVMLPLDPKSGDLSFRRVREPVPPLPNIPSSLFSDSLPEQTTHHGPKKADKLVFQFNDRDHSFGDMTIMVKDDGSIAYAEIANARTVPIASTVHFDTAAVLAEQRSQEELAGAAAIDLRLLRSARELVPGDAFTADGFPDVLLVTSVDVDPLSEETVVSVMPNFYGIKRSDFVNQPGGGSSERLDPEADLFRWSEVPEHLLSTEEILVMVPRIRAHAQTSHAIIHFSRDDVSYVVVGEEAGTATGGTLDVALDADGPKYQAQGPTFQVVGPDANAALDLSSDLTNWALGRQLVLLVNSDGEEIAFAQKITALGGGQYRLDGFLRARYDTRRIAHPVGTEVYVFANDELTPFQDLLLVAGADLYAKSQPVATGGALPLAAVAPDGDLIRGKGLVPIDPDRVYVAAPNLGSPSYGTGNDVTLRWTWSSAASPNTGAGYQDSGTPIGSPVMKGAFVVQLLTPSNTLVRTDTVMVPEITYLNATLAASPINQGNFKVRVFHEYNGYSSAFAELTVTKV